MFFKKKRRMVDIRELQKRGVVVRVPRKESVVPTDSDGFVELGKGVGSSVAGSIVSGVGSDSDSSMVDAGSSSGGSGSANFFGFMGDSDSGSVGGTLSSDTTPSEDLRKISGQLADLDNKIYKIEQRIELLERKAGVGDNPSVGAAGW
jgi:hypothetical protein